MRKRFRATLHTGTLASSAIVLCLFQAAIARAQSGFEMGISVHLAGDPGMLPRQLSVISQAGANTVRDEVAWANVEQEKGHLAVPSGVDHLVNQALNANLQPLLILDYGNRFYDLGDKPLSPQALSALAIVLHVAVSTTSSLPGVTRPAEAPGARRPEPALPLHDKRYAGACSATTPTTRIDARSCLAADATPRISAVSPIGT